MRLQKGTKGQAMVEYVLVLSLISLVFLVQTGFMQKLVQMFFEKILNIYWYPIP